MPPKYYAVRKGKTPGIFMNCITKKNDFQGEDCKKSVHGYPSEYKSFKTLDEATHYLLFEQDKRVHEH